MSCCAFLAVSGRLCLGKAVDSSKDIAHTMGRVVRVGKWEVDIPAVSIKTDKVNAAVPNISSTSPRPLLTPGDSRLLTPKPPGVRPCTIPAATIPPSICANAVTACQPSFRHSPSATQQDDPSIHPADTRAENQAECTAQRRVGSGRGR